MNSLSRAMLLARTSKQLPQNPPTTSPAPAPIPEAAPVLTETELAYRGLTERVKYLEGAVARVLNELGIRIAPPEKTRAFPSVHQCIVATALYYGFSVHDILGHSHRATHAHARHVAMYVAKQMTLATYPMIGRIFEGRDHTTVLHGVRKIETNRKADAILDQDIHRICEDVLKETPKSAPVASRAVASEAVPPSRPPSGEGTASLPPVVG